MRELEEELGLSVPSEDFKLLFHTRVQHLLHGGIFYSIIALFNRNAISGKYIDNELVDVYLIERDVDLATLTLQKEEVSEVKCIFHNIVLNFYLK